MLYLTMGFDFVSCFCDLVGCWGAVGYRWNWWSLIALRFAIVRVCLFVRDCFGFNLIFRFIY